MNVGQVLEQDLIVVVSSMRCTETPIEALAASQRSSNAAALCSLIGD